MEKESELKYALNLLNGLTEEIFDEILQVFYDVVDKKNITIFSDSVLSFFKDNLLHNPVTASTILSFFQNSAKCSDQYTNVIQNMYKEILTTKVTDITKTEEFISLLSLLRLDEEFLQNFSQNVLEKITEDQFRQHKKELFISLITLDRPQVLTDLSNRFNKISNFESHEFTFSADYMLTLCYEHNQHWLLKALETYKFQLEDVKRVNFEMNKFTKQLLMLITIDIVNCIETSDLSRVFIQLENLLSILNSYSSTDKQLEFYVTEIFRAFNVLKFCLENSNCKTISMSYFNQSLIQSALSIISQYCVLSNIDRYKMSRLLSINNDTLMKLKVLNGEGGGDAGKSSHWDITVYNSYCIITMVLDFIVQSNNSSIEETNILDEIKLLLLGLNPVAYQIEVIENVFACLFLRYEYYSCNEYDQTCSAHSECSYFVSKKNVKCPHVKNNSNVGFICNAQTTQAILTTLKEIICKIENEISSDDSTENVSRLKHISKLVNDSLWKLQLVSNLSPDQSSVAPLKICLDYADFGDSSEDEEAEKDVRISRKKPRLKKRNSNTKSDNEPVGSSQMSSSIDGPWWVSRDTDFTSLLLASPSSLVALALHHNHFTKANQIVEMYDLSDSEIAAEVNFIEQYKQLVIKINNIIFPDTEQSYPIKELTSFSLIPAGVVSLVEGFLASQKSPDYHEVVELARRYSDLQLYDPRNSNLINAIDLLLSTGVQCEVTYGLINIIEKKLTDVQIPREIGTKKNNYIQFIKDAISIMFEIFGKCETTSPMYVDNMCSVVSDCRIPLKHKDFTNLKQYSTELTKYYEDLSVTLNTTSPNGENFNFQKCHQTYMNVVSISDKDLCSILETYPALKRKPRTHYLRACYIYVKNISQMETNSDKHLSPDFQSDRTYFCMMNKHLNDLIGELIYEKASPITSLEPICKKLSINLVHKLLLNFCPPIQVENVQTEPNEDSFNSLLQMVYAFHDTEEEMFIEHTENFCPLPRPLDSAATSYIVLHNWVIANLIQKVHSASQNSQIQQSVDFRTRNLNNYMELERFDNLKVMFGGNKTITSLQSCINLNELFKFMMKLVNSGKLVQCLQILDSLSEGQLLQNSNLMNLRDFILFKLALNSRIENSWKYTYHLKCTELRIDLVLNNLSSWPAEGSLEVLDVLRYNKDIGSVDDTVVTKCKNWLKSIPVYQQIAETSSLGGWFDVYEKSIDNPKEVLETLMDNQQFKLCLQWTNFHDISNNMKCLIISSLLRQLFEYTSQTDAQEIRTLLKELPIPQAVELVHKNVSKIHNLEILQEIMIFINENSSNSKLFENIKIGLLIMSEIELNVRNLFWDIIDKPLLIIEQYLMNAKLEILASIIAKISLSLINDPAGDSLYFNIKVIDSIIISTNSVDALLRVYAEKALDMRCAPKVGLPASRKTNEDYFLQSIDSINLMGTNGPFVMPDQVPSKEQWVRDEQAERCMLCRLAIFSMLIRRHHCRRCGRLVCHTCSRHRMQVASYAEGVQVRVCDDCYNQTASSKLLADGDKATLLSSSGSGCDSSVASMDWCLGADANRNNHVRREFSYEFTPNVTLCLTIMKMHSLNLDYPRFLLDRSEEMARALGTGGAAPRLLLRARRSLLLAASELYSRFLSEDSGSGTGVGTEAEAGAAHAARRLAHTASLALLVKHGCQHLAPPDGALPGQYVRRLLEAEKWELALEIATKSGVPRNSVLAAWGKACLKAGCFKQARDKLAHCFRNSVTVQNIHVEPPPEDCEFGKEANESSPFTAKSVLSKMRSSDRWSSTSSLQSEGLRPKQNPPLLNEIISILENVNFPVKTEQRNKAEAVQISKESTSSTRGKLAQEPALTITHAFASVERIKLGDYSHLYVTNSPKKAKTLGIPQTLLRRQSSLTEPKNNDPVNKLDPFFFNESVYYLSNYGSHVGNIAFYLKNGTVADVLKYCRDNTVEKEVFTEAVYMDCLKNNRVVELIKCMQEMDSTWEIWSDYLTHTCRALESSGQLSALYWLQTATGEQARAGATCARIYCASAICAGIYATLVQRQHYLVSARAHLMQCVPTTAATSTQHKNVPPNSHQLRLDSATLEKHINTVSRQMEVARFLARCEQNNRINEKIMADIFPTDPPRQETDMIKPLTLFGTLADKTKLATLILVCGENVLEGYSLAHRIMDDNKVDAWRVYSVCARVLICNNRFMELRDLCRRFRETSSPSSSCQALSDSVLEAGVAALVRHCDARGQLFDEQAELLIEDIQNIAVKIACYMECRILASAYILAVKHGRLNDLRRILREAERLGQDQVRHACTKRLAAHKML